MADYSDLTPHQKLDMMFLHFQRTGLKKDKWLEMRALAHELGYSDHELCTGSGLVLRETA